MTLLQGCVALQVIQTASAASSAYYAKKMSENTIVGTECNWTQPIYFDGDVEGLTDEDLR